MSLVVRASDVRSSSIRWAWLGRLAIGYLAVMTGEEGLGKSVFMAWLVARMTQGELEGQWHHEPASVLIIAGEDGIADTWRPRLDLAGADLSRVVFLDLDALGPEWNLRDGVETIAAAIEETGARFIYIDAALDHMPAPKAGESINSPTYARAALGPLRKLVRSADLSAAFSMHPPKARGANFRDLVQASQAFSAIPRIGWLLANHPGDDPGDPDRRRVLIRGKGNLGRDPGALEFQVVGREFRHDDGITTEREVVTSVGPSMVTIADLAPRIGAREPIKAEQAAELIRTELADGAWHESAPILARLRPAGLASSSVVQTARELAKVEIRKRPGAPGGPWEWRINAASSPDDDSGGFLASSPAARARRISDTASSPSTSSNSSNDGKKLRSRPFRGSEASNRRSRQPGVYAHARGDGREVDDEPDADATLERITAKFGDDFQ